jgi:NAD(P) transhydrogenase subunit alpha
MPEHASELYSKNITALLELMVTDGQLAPDFDDVVIAEACVTGDERSREGRTASDERSREEQTASGGSN